MPKQEQEELKARLSNKALQACNKEFRELDDLLSKIKTKADTHLLLAKYQEHVKTFWLIVAFFYSQNDVTLSGGDEVISPLMTQSVCETMAQLIFSNFTRLPLAIGVAGMVYGRYINLGDGMMDVSPPISSIVTIGPLQKNVAKYFVRENMIADNEQKLMTLLLCLLLVHIEARLLQELPSKAETDLRGAKIQGLCGTVSAVISGCYNLPIWVRTFFTVMTGYIILGQKKEEHGAYANKLSALREDDAELFFLGLALLCKFFVEDSSDIKVRGVLPAAVIRKAYRVLLKNGKELVFKELLNKDDGVIEPTHEFLWLTEQTGSRIRAPKKVSPINDPHTVVKKQSRPPQGSALNHIGCYPSWQPLPAPERPEQSIQYRLQHSEFQPRIKKIIIEYNAIKAHVARSRGWSRWLADQLRILCVYSDFLPSFMRLPLDIDARLVAISSALQSILVFRRKTIFSQADWSLPTAKICDHIKRIAQQHFALQIDLVAHFEKREQGSVAHWLAGFYPYTPQMDAERVLLSNFADRLLTLDIQLREVGSSLYWPKASEDIDLIVWSSCKTEDEIVCELSKLNQFGWFPSQLQKVEDRYSSISYHHARYKSLDVVIYPDFSEKLLRENLSSRLINITSAITNIGFSWVYLLTDDAKGIYENKIECSAAALQNKKGWKILTKVIWKMNSQRLDNYGDNFSQYRQDLYNVNSKLTLIHLVQLMNQAVTLRRIQGLRDLYLDILQGQNPTLFIPSFLGDNRQAAQEKFDRYLHSKDTNFKGWLIVLFYGIKAENFFAQSKLGLDKYQMESLQKLRRVCLSFDENPFAKNLSRCDFNGIFRNLFECCRDYCVQRVEPAELKLWKDPG